jgi:hypothetical protein
MKLFPILYAASATLVLSTGGAFAATDSKNISDGAAKGQASERTATAPDKGCSAAPSASPAKENGSLSTYRTTDNASPAACKKLPGKLKRGQLPN